jgi:hypothetical protein
MAITISGLKTGLFQQLDYQQVAHYAGSNHALKNTNASVPEYE